jgi:hypothetical protein
MGRKELNYDFDVMSPSDSLNLIPEEAYLMDDIINSSSIDSRPEVNLLHSKTALSSQQVKLAKS